MGLWKEPYVFLRLVSEHTDDLTMVGNLLRYSIAPLMSQGFPAGAYLYFLLSFSACTGQAQTASKTSTVQTAVASNSSALEPIRWRDALRQEEGWYSSPEAMRIADNLLLYQRDNGGWDKNMDMAKVLTEKEEEELRSPIEKGRVSTIDNKATFTQMEYLARVYQATGQEKYKASFLRGMDYLYEAQYENGGWPQFYPIREGYYEHITFNDGAMIGVMRLLRDVAQDKPTYSFVDATRKSQAAKAVEKGVEAILKTQIKVNGHLTAWCAQHDKTNFAPQKARAYELPSISGGESVGIVKFLMEMEQPNQEVINAVDGAVSWLERVKVEGIRLDKVEIPSINKGYDLVVVNDPAAPALLARFYKIGTNQPMFVGRDGIVRETIAEIEQERRVGYSWYLEFPQDLVEKAYPAWKQKWKTAE